MSIALGPRAASLATAIALGWSALGAGQATAPPATVAPPTTVAPPAARSAGERSDGAARMARNIWWNGRIGDSVAMTPAQRQAADGFLRQFQERSRARAGEMADVRAAIKAALERGDWAPAREETTRLARLTSETASQQIELQIQVLSTLTPEQRKLLAEKHPLVIGTPWIRGGGRGGAPREGGPPRRPAP